VQIKTNMAPLDPGQLALAFGFGIVGLAIVTWVVVVLRELPEGAPGLNKYVSSVISFVFNAAPAQADVKNSSLPVKIIVKGIIPLVFWILLIVPMVVFPIILILFPLLHIPWSYLLPVP
jgi:hypothetical protein